MSLLMLYLLTRLNHIINFCDGINCVASIALLALLFVACLLSDSYKDETTAWAAWRQLFKIVCSLLVISNLILVFIPSERDLYLMLGGVYATNDKEIAKLPDNLVGAANSFLEHYKSEQEATPKPSK